FENEPSIQFCATLKGEYDLLLYIIADKDLGITDVILDRIVKNALPNYTLTWHIKIALDLYNFIPIRELFFDMLKERVWRRSKDNPRPLPRNIKLRDYLLLKELNLNSIESFRHIDVKHNLDYGNSRYSYFDLQNKKIISRPTINMTKLPLKYNAIVEMTVLQRTEFEKTRNYYRAEVVKDTKYPINKYALSCSIRDPNGVILIMPIIENDWLENTMANLENKVKGVRFTASIITSILIGDLCYRLFDNLHSLQYRNLVESSNLQKTDITNYL
ncbi:MAG: hypothetical protein KGH49_03975, partial [Candidatus Micrarchaeota archaeon]|nr:hypothetical protein [Candidatus Micrarchaeota archaeon]